MSNQVHEYRLGRFEIAVDMLQVWEELLPVMSNIVVVKCYLKASTYEYVGYSRFFEPLGNCLVDEVPWYTFIATRNQNSMEILIKRVWDEKITGHILVLKTNEPKQT